MPKINVRLTAVLATCIAASSAIVQPALAWNIGTDDVQHKEMKIHNSTQNAMLVTVYGLPGKVSKIDSDCLSPNTTRTFTGWSYNLLHNVYVRAEIKPSASRCTDRTLYDIGPSYQATSEFTCSNDKLGKYPTCWDSGSAGK